MARADLRAFLAALERAGELRRVGRPGRPEPGGQRDRQRVVRGRRPGAAVREPTRATDAAGDQPVRHASRRMAMALGVDALDEIGDRIGELLKPELPVGWSGIREALGKARAAAVGAAEDGRSPRPARRSCYKGDDVDLGPAARHPGLARRRRHLPQPRPDPHQASRRPARATSACTGCSSTTRARVGMHWQIHKDSNAHHAVAERRGERLPVAIAFGCEPGGHVRGDARRCRPTSTSTCSPASCAASGSRWSTA